MRKMKTPKIKVSFYNKKHMKLLEKNVPEHFEAINTVVEKGHYLNEDFWIYSVFYHQYDFDGYRTFQELSELWVDFYNLTKRYFESENETVRAKLPSGKFKGLDFSERIGVAGGLSLISKIHGLTEADWNIIPISGKKDLDYEISSDGKNIIEVECKGSFVPDDKITSTVSKHKKSIKEKKEAKREGNSSDNILYGVITTYSDNDNYVAHSRILDPVSDRKYESPYKLRILSRLSFYLKEIGLISNAHFLIALANRIRDIHSLDNDSYLHLNGVPLIKANGDKFDFPVSLSLNKSIVTSNLYPSFGDMKEINDNEYLFFGFDKEIIKILINQDFSELLKYHKKPVTFNSKLEGKIKKQNSNKVISLDLLGHLHQNSAGRVIGIATKT